MLRFEQNKGWWLITHTDHAQLAGEFASKWGNDLFASPEPRDHVLRGIYTHDDGWRTRDADPVITRQGKPAAFSKELVGKYSAFEEIDLKAYLAVRREAVQCMAQQDPYAAILISMHTHNLLSERSDRSALRAEDLQRLDAFLVEQTTLQRALWEQLITDRTMDPMYLKREVLQQHFRLLQACDNLSLLSCVDFDEDATLLHPFVLKDGALTEIKIKRVEERVFRLTPYPFAQPKLTFRFPARYVPGESFASSEELRDWLDLAQAVDIGVTVMS